MSFSGWLPSYPACHWNTETRDWLRPGGPTCLRPNPTPHCLPLRSEAVLSFWLGSSLCC
uniref:Kringle domain-containing protein n=1 Tax=Mesocestoides corti TaxID=53468 RepID=A0A5K3EM66_MESCO